MTRSQLPLAKTFRVDEAGDVELRTDAATLQISAELHDRVRAEAERRGCSMSEVVELALAEPLGQPAPPAVRRHHDGQYTSRRDKPSISVSAACFARLKAEADARGVSIASIVEAAVADVGGAA